MARRPSATRLPACAYPSLLLLLLLLTTAAAREQQPDPAIPAMTKALQGVLPQYYGTSTFWDLWEYASEHDAPKGPVIRGSGGEAKTVLAPSADAEAHLIPQDAGDVRFGSTSAHKALRRDYLLDHLLAESLAPSDPRLRNGVTLRTASGKAVTFTKDEEGVVSVNGVVVESTSSLPGGTYIYILSDILFDNRQRVASEYTRNHLENDRLGPPLDLTSIPVIRAPAPPPPGTPGIAKPPAPPLELAIIKAPAPPTKTKPRSPGSLPPNGVVRAPAPPPAVGPPAATFLPPGTIEVVGPPALPPSGSVVRGPLRLPSRSPVLNRVRRQLQFPLLEGLVEIDPVLRSGGDDLRFFPPPPPSLAHPSHLSSSSPSSFSSSSSSSSASSFSSFSSSSSLSAPSLPFTSSSFSSPSSSSSSFSSSSSSFSSSGEPDHPLALYSLPKSERQEENENNNERMPTRESETKTEEEAKRELDAPRDPLTSIDLFATLFRGDPDGDSGTGAGVVELLRREGLTTLLLLLETSGLLNFLISGERGPYIVLAPSEQAFAKLTRQELRQAARSTDLAYHLLPLQGLPAPEVTNDATFATLLGPEVRFNVYGDSVYVNGAKVVRGDVHFNHGTIQVVEAVLSAPVGDLQTVLVANGPSFSRVNTLLTVVDIPLLPEGSYTLLAPPDSAITSKGYSWHRLLMSRECGRNLLARHLLKGSWYSEGLLQHRTLTTLAGTSVTFRRDSDGIISANGVPLRTPNLTATNGVVHLVVDVLPESDVGTDPTSLPLPLLSQTEAPAPIQTPLVLPPLPVPQPSPPALPSPPSVSGLYETPERDPFLSFIPVKSPTPTQKTPPFEETIESRMAPTPPTPTTTTLSTRLLHKDDAPEGIPEPPVAKLMSPSGQQQLLELLRLVDCGGRPVSLPAPQTIIRSLPSGQGGSLGLHGTQQKVHLRQDENEVVAASSFRQQETVKEQGSIGHRENAINIAYVKEHLSPTKAQTADTRHNPSPQSHPHGSAHHAPVVPEGVTVWRPPGALTESDRRRVDVVGLLKHLNLTLFSRMVERADLTFVLDHDGPWTVFAPSDEALTAIPREPFLQIVSQRPFLRRLVSYHLAPGRLTRASFTHGLRIPTLHAGHALMMSYYTDGPAAQRWVAGGSVVTALDQRASNGVVHVLDRVLYPPYGDLPTTLSLSPILTVFAALLARRPALLRFLSGPGPLTLFVPSDAAMYNISLPRDPDVLDAWVRAHVVEDAWYTSGFSNTWPLISITNHTLSTAVSPSQDKITVNGVLITYADITASNGVLHVLQSPLFIPT